MSTTKIYLFVASMTVVVALLLTGFRMATAEQAEINEKVFNKRAILKSLADGLDGDLDEMSDDEVQAVFQNNVQQFVVKADGSVVEGLVAENVKMKQDVKKKPANNRFCLLLMKYVPSGCALRSPDSRLSWGCLVIIASGN